MTFDLFEKIFDEKYIDVDDALNIDIDLAPPPEKRFPMIFSQTLMIRPFIF